MTQQRKAVLILLAALTLAVLAWAIVSNNNGSDDYKTTEQDMPEDAEEVAPGVYVSGVMAYADDCDLIEQHREAITEAIGYDGWGHACG